MIVDRTNDGATQNGNLVAHKYAMTVDPTAMAHIMRTMTDLYSDKILAVIREYSTNAWDAHIEGGFAGPIEVTLPTRLSSYFVVRDYGVGLDEAGIARYYAQYGASSKRNTNGQVGMLGYGCKSALSYTSQFTVTSVKDGYKIVVVVSRNADGTGGMQVLKATKTDEANGTEVKVPANPADAGAFEQKAKDFFSYWTPGLVLVNGHAPVRFEGLRLTDDLYLVEGDRYAQGHLSKVVMGNVAYPLEKHRIDALTALSNSLNIVAFVGIGDIMFTPSREALSYGEQVTQRALAKIGKDFNDKMQGAVQQEVNTATSAAEAIRIVSKWDKLLPAAIRGSAQYKYKGMDVPRNFALPSTIASNGDSIQHTLQTTPNNDYHGALSTVHKHWTFEAEKWGRAVWITGFDLGKLTASHKRKMFMWLKAQREAGKIDPGAQIDQYVLLPPHVLPATGKAVAVEPPTDWIDKNRVVPWATINALKLPRTVVTSRGNRPTGAYDAFLDGDNFKHQQVADLDLRDKKPMLYMNGNRYEGRFYLDILGVIFPQGYTLACLPANRVEKFKRTFTKAQDVQSAIRVEYEKWHNSLSPAIQLGLAIFDAAAADELKALDASKIKDPKLVKAIQAAKVDISTYEAQRRKFQRYVSIKDAIKWENPLKRYPLYTHYDEPTSYDIRYYSDAAGRSLTKIMPHVYAYINAVHAASI